MKKKLAVTLLVLGVSMLFCSMARQKTVRITGTISSYGNVPFTFLGIVTEDGREFGIIAEQSIQDELRSAAGKLIEFRGIIVVPEEAPALYRLKDGVFELHSFKVKK